MAGRRNAGARLAVLFATLVSGAAGPVADGLVPQSDLDQFMEPGSMANIVTTDEVAGELEVQGRTVRTLVYRQTGLHGLRADLSGDKPPYFGLSLLDDEPIEPEELIRFLEPFDVWRGDD